MNQGIECPKCGSPHSTVEDISYVCRDVIRLRSCTSCGETFKTYEIVQKIKYLENVLNNLRHIQ